MWTIEGFLNNEFVVNCQTEDEANEFFKILKQHNVDWRGSLSLDLETFFCRYREKTCYCHRSELSYANISFYESNNYTVIPYRQLILSPTLYQLHRQNKILFKLLIKG